ncbi:uncharacterized protein LOC131199631 [Ahaetulla prasina]|uniref:uncharacterized protein LOC131199631 n=1 Tax=Ahaetulla prasina TaxID=499056 RepID=UPI0026471F36|nr:uncharacterized protein LOC131199631 [Ahaetulla prasina]
MPGKNSNRPAKHPQTKIVNTNNDPNEPRICYKCNESTNESDEFKKCRLCTNYAHHSCLKINKTIDNFLQSDPIFIHLCPSCFPKLDYLTSMSDRAHTMETTIKSQQTIIDSMEESLEKRILACLEPRFTNLEKKITAQNNGNLADQNLLPIQQTLPNPQSKPQLSANQPTNIAILVKDTIEKEQKCQNAILFGLDNSNEPDITKVRNIIKNYNSLTFFPDEIIEVSRDGPEYKNSDGSVAPKFCRVICINETSKCKFIHAINSIARTTSSHNKRRSWPDLSFLQRIRSRELCTELKRRQDEGETNLYIDYRADCIKRKTYNQLPNIQPPITQNIQPSVIQNFQPSVVQNLQPTVIQN